MKLISLKTLTILIILIISLSSCASVQSSAMFRNSSVENRILGSIAKLYISKDGSDKYWGCTAYPVSRSSNKYIFLTAAHCVLIKDKNDKYTGKTAKRFLLSFKDYPEQDGKLYDAKLVAHEYDKIENKDFALLEAYLPFYIPIIYLSSNEPTENQCVVNIGFPSKEKTRIHYGYVEKTYQFENYFVVRLGGVLDPHGSSGSPIIECLSGKNVGIMVSVASKNTPDKIIVFSWQSLREFLKSNNVSLDY
ncbi:MAG: serine protease [bacterium]|nr:serine protease [bacterium]